MERVIKETWREVEVDLELAAEFDPELLATKHPGYVPLLAELLVGPPRRWREAGDLAPFAGLHSLQAKHEQLRLTFVEIRHLGEILDRLFAALEFALIGKRILQVRPLGLGNDGDWRAEGHVWLCHRPLEQAQASNL